MSKWYGLVVVSVFLVAGVVRAEATSQAPVGPKTVRMEASSDSPGHAREKGGKNRE
jgi:hypothetical protein